MSAPDTARDAWDWDEARRKQRVLVEEPLRPREMLAAHGYDARHRCGDCRQYIPGQTARTGRCRLSLRGSPPGAGYRWEAGWKSCGQWQTRDVAETPAEATPGAQLALPPDGRA